MRQIASSISNFFSMKIGYRLMWVFAIINCTISLAFCAYQFRLFYLMFKSYADIFPNEDYLPYSDQYTMRYQQCQANEYACQNSNNSFAMCAFSLKNCPDTKPFLSIYDNIKIYKTKYENVKGFQIYYRGDYLSNLINLFSQNMNLEIFNSTITSDVDHYLKKINYQVIEKYENATIIQFVYYYNQTTAEIENDFKEATFYPFLFKSIDMFIGMLQYLLWGFTAFLTCSSCSFPNYIYSELRYLNNLERIFLLVMVKSSRNCYLFLWMVPFFLATLLLPFMKLGSLLCNTYVNLFQYDNANDLSKQLSESLLDILKNLNLEETYKQELIDDIINQQEKLDQLFYRNFIGRVIFAVSFIYTFIMSLSATLNIFILIYQIYSRRCILSYRKIQNDYIPFYLHQMREDVYPENYQ